MTEYQALAAVRNYTGKHIRLGMFERAAACTMTETRVVVLIDRASVKETRYGYEVTRRGNTIHEFNLIDGAWVASEPLTVWYDLDEPEIHKSYAGKTPEEYEQWLQWTDMCHRPGTPEYPMDNLERRQQGIK